MRCKCGKPLTQRLVAVKTQQVGDDVIVLESRDAMVCSEHGVVAWGRQAQPMTQMPPPWRNPYPPSGPAPPAILPNQTSPFQPFQPHPNRPQIIC